MGAIGEGDRMRQIYTVGYGNRQPEDFLSMLEDHAITHVLDVRFEPKGWHGGYSGPNLEKALKKRGIHYQHAPALGVPKNLRDSLPNAYKVLPEDFEEAYREAVAPILGNYLRAFDGEKVVLICCEKDPQRCHRSILAEMLVEKGHFTWWEDLNARPRRDPAQKDLFAYEVVE